MDGAAPVDAQNASTAAWKTRRERGFPTPSTPVPVCGKKNKSIKGKNGPTTTVQNYAFSGERRQLTSKCIWDAVRVAAKAAGIDRRVSPHTLRHYLPSLTMSSGVKQRFVPVGRCC